MELRRLSAASRNGKLVARRGRKATGLSEFAELPKEGGGPM